MKKTLTILFAVMVIMASDASWAFAAEKPAVTKKQYYKRLKYNKNLLPAGWQYEAGYIYWRTHHGLPTNIQTYRAYRRDKAWSYTLKKYNTTGERLLSTLDWTALEVGRFWETYNEYLKFQPAGLEESYGP